MTQPAKQGPSSLSATTIAACFALAAFSVAVLAGITAENGVDRVLTRAFLATSVCFLLGLFAALAINCVLADCSATSDNSLSGTRDVPVPVPDDRDPIATR